MILARDLVHRGSDLDWQEGFEQALLAADIESGAVQPDFDAHVVNANEEMKFDMAVSCLRGGMRLTNARMEYLREECEEDNIGEFCMVYLAVAYDHGCRKPNMDDILRAWHFVDEENQQLRYLRWAVDAGVRAGMKIDPGYVSLNFDDFEHVRMIAKHMDVPVEYFEGDYELQNYRCPDTLMTVVKERDRLTIFKAVLRSVPHATWSEYEPVVQSFVKYGAEARRIVQSMRNEMTAMVLAFRALFDTPPMTRTRRGKPAQLAALPVEIKRRIVNAAARSKPLIGYMKFE